MRAATGGSMISRVMSTWRRNPSSSQEVRHLTPSLPESRGGTQQRMQRRECTPTTTRSFTLTFTFTLARLRRRREAFLNPGFPERCLAGDGCGCLIAVEVEV
jgi:hypothetical protein